MAEFDYHKNLVGFLDLPEKVESREEMVTAINEKYISRNEASKDKEIIGSINGLFERKVKQAAKAAGITFDEGELSDKEIPEIVAHSFQKQKATYSDQIEELKKNTKPSDEVKKWEDKFLKQGESLKQYKDRSTELAGEVDQMKKDKDNFIKTQKVHAHKEAAVNAVEFSNQISTYEKRGFLSTLDDTYKPETDEDGNIFPTKEGNRIANKDKKDKFLSYSELYNFEADKAGLTAKNQVVKRQQVTKMRQTSNGIVEPPKRKIATRAV